ncbi:MAG: hypothetical protein IIB15_02290 [Chloroflexi bacterium]|nr:hypothetical protein [Chloroflexota bacterium]
MATSMAAFVPIPLNSPANALPESRRLTFEDSTVTHTLPPAPSFRSQSPPCRGRFTLKSLCPSTSRLALAICATSPLRKTSVA